MELTTRAPFQSICRDCLQDRASQLDPLEAYRVAEGVLAYLYTPSPDMRLPLGATAVGDWALATWDIETTGEAAIPRYLLLLASPSRAPEPLDIVLESQFGSEPIAIAEVKPFETCSSQGARRISTACLRAVATGKLNPTLGLLAAIAPHIAASLVVDRRASLATKRTILAALGFAPSSVFLLSSTLQELEVEAILVRKDGLAEIALGRALDSRVITNTRLIFVSALGAIEVHELSAGVL